MEELSQKIKKSDAFKYLKAEQLIHQELEKNNWVAHHGSFYKDPSTNKLREIDIVGERRWNKEHKVLDSNIYLQIDLIIESKSISNYHLLFSGLRKATVEHFRSNEDWVGYDDYSKEKIKEKLSNENIPLSKIKEILKILEEASFPDDTAVISEFMIKSFPVLETFTTFSETNLGNIKELDNSVLWKALSAIESCIKSKKNQSIESMLSNLMMDLKYNTSANSLSERLFLFKDAPLSIRYFHPIVVIDSKLWSTTEDKPFELKWCRFYLEKNDFFSNWWCDIVSRNHFSEYLSSLSEHYKGKVNKILEIEEP